MACLAGRLFDLDHRGLGERTGRALEGALIVTLLVRGLDAQQEHRLSAHRASTHADRRRGGRVVVVWKLHDALLAVTGYQQRRGRWTEVSNEPFMRLATRLYGRF
jgi:hypothetical protein